MRNFDCLEVEIQKPMLILVAVVMALNLKINKFFNLIPNQRDLTVYVLLLNFFINI